MEKKFEIEQKLFESDYKVKYKREGGPLIAIQSVDGMNHKNKISC